MKTVVIPSIHSKKNVKPVEERNTKDKKIKEPFSLFLKKTKSEKKSNEKSDKFERVNSKNVKNKKDDSRSSVQIESTIVLLKQNESLKNKKEVRFAECEKTAKNEASASKNVERDEKGKNKTQLLQKHEKNGGVHTAINWKSAKSDIHAQTTLFKEEKHDKKDKRSGSSAISANQIKVDKIFVEEARKTKLAEEARKHSNKAGIKRTDSKNITSVFTQAVNDKKADVTKYTKQKNFGQTALNSSDLTKEINENEIKKRIQTARANVENDKKKKEKRVNRSELKNVPSAFAQAVNDEKKTNDVKHSPDPSLSKSVKLNSESTAFEGIKNQNDKSFEDQSQGQQNKKNDFEDVILKFTRETKKSAKNEFTNFKTYKKFEYISQNKEIKDYESLPQLSRGIVQKNTVKESNQSKMGNIPRRISTQIITAVSKALENQKPPLKVEIQLNPPDLGKITMEITERAGKTSFLLNVENEKTREIMKMALPIMTNQLSNLNFNVVSVQINGQQWFDDGANQQGHRREQQEQKKENKERNFTEEFKEFRKEEV
jgi:flagellar hook-length control protein FliK